MRNTIAASLALIALLGAALPAIGPLPQNRPGSKPAIETPPPEHAGETPPVPPQKPAVKPSLSTDPAPDPDLAPKTDDDQKPPSGRKPLSQEVLPETNLDKASSTPPRGQVPGELPQTIAAEGEDAYRTCKSALAAIGATFVEESRIDDGLGCGIDRPVTLTRLLPSVALEPQGTLRCETALQLARMTRDMLIPAARLALAEKGELKAINHASTYVCRKRNGSANGRISEHARGNAVDIAALTFDRGIVPMAIAKQDDGTFAAAFQRSLNAMACLYFRTVLSPGSDAAHQDHLHLDILERQNGHRYCR